MNSVYDDEDNVPMNESDFDRDGHNPTVYLDAYEAKMWDKYGEPLPFTDPPENGCWNCLHYDYKKEACTLNWNNMDESYYNPNCDDREPDDCCPEHETDPDAEWEDWHGTDT